MITTPDYLENTYKKACLMHAPAVGSHESFHSKANIIKRKPGLIRCASRIKALGDTGRYLYPEPGT